MSQKELLDAKATIAKHEATIQDLEREVSELESLIESKIYQQDDLENRISELERDLERARASAGASSARSASHAAGADQHRSVSGTSASSASTNGTSGSGSMISSAVEREERCELCEGPHELDSCPVFQGNLDALSVPGSRDSPLGTKSSKWCADCEVGLFSLQNPCGRL